MGSMILASRKLVSRNPVGRTSMDQTSRRKFLLPIIALGAALIALTLAFYRQIVSIMFRLFSPRIDISAETVVNAGPVAHFREPRVYTNLKVSHGIWIIHEPGGTVFALRSVCTHLGCTPDWKSKLNKFVCPCHGSEYDVTGVNIKGPTKRPLERLKIATLDDKLFIDQGVVFREELGQWDHPDASVDLGPN